MTPALCLSVPTSLFSSSRRVCMYLFYYENDLSVSIINLSSRAIAYLSACLIVRAISLVWRQTKQTREWTRVSIHNARAARASLSRVFRAAPLAARDLWYDLAPAPRFPGGVSRALARRRSAAAQRTAPGARAVEQRSNSSPAIYYLPLCAPAFATLYAHLSCAPLARIDHNARKIARVYARKAPALRIPLYALLHIASRALGALRRA